MATSYGPLFDALIPTNCVNDLGPGKPNEPLRSKLQDLSTTTAFAGQKVVDSDAARCCLAGIWLLHDFLDESHTISQEVETVLGSYWHGIMHRREPDYFNSKYWFRRVGNHRVFPRLLIGAQALIAEAGAEDLIAKEILQARDWDPYRFVDWCEQLARGQAKQELLARKIAREEWDLLFADCYARAIGG